MDSSKISEIWFNMIKQSVFIQNDWNAMKDDEKMFHRCYNNRLTVWKASSVGDNFNEKRRAKSSLNNLVAFDYQSWF